MADLRVLELFAGIGGAAVALRGLARVRLAVDQDRAARAAYAARFDHAMSARNLHHVKPDWFEDIRADLWWMSPPCQPYTIRGHQRDLEDRRSLAFQRVCDAIDVHRPRHVAMENVPWFAGSDGERLLRGVLAARGYQVWSGQICPTVLGVPAARRRYYLVASREGLGPPTDAHPARRPLATFLDPTPDPSLTVPDALARRYAGALHVVEADDPEAVAACFTGAYGRSPVHAGSYVRQEGVVRWLSPVEIGRTLGLGEVPFPAGLRRKVRYKLVGNSLSVWAVQRVLSRIPELHGGLAARLNG